MRNKIAVFHGGPGLSPSYMDHLSQYCSERSELLFHTPPGCTLDTANASTSFEATVASYAQWFESLLNLGVRDVFAHSWGVLIFQAVVRKLNADTSQIRAAFWNPVPLDRGTYDVAVARLVQRVTPEASEAMNAAGALGAAAGSKIMDLAWPFYSPGATKPSSLVFEYFPSTFAAVSSGLDAFDYWGEIRSMASRVELVFGELDYIVPEDFQSLLHSGVTLRKVPGGHFPFVEDPQLFDQSLLWLAKSSA